MTQNIYANRYYDQQIRQVCCRFLRTMDLRQADDRLTRNHNDLIRLRIRMFPRDSPNTIHAELLNNEHFHQIVIVWKGIGDINL